MALHPQRAHTRLASAGALFIASLLFTAPTTSAEEKAPEQKQKGDTSVALSSAVLNPTTLLWQFQLEEFAIFQSRKDDDFAQNFRIRAIVPLEKGLLIPVPQLFRIIGFINTEPGGSTGLGDVTINQFFILARDDWGEFGAGWDLTAPTASPDKLGSQQWQLGPTATIAFSDLGNWQLYWVWQNFFSLNKNGKHGSQAYTVIQPNLFYTWSNGLYMGTEPLWQVDYQSGDLAIPLNFRVGYIFEKGKYKYNTYIEPEWMTYRSSGPSRNNDNWGIRFGFRIFLPEN